MKRTFRPISLRSRPGGDSGRKMLTRRETAGTAKPSCWLRAGPRSRRRGLVLRGAGSDPPAAAAVLRGPGTRTCPYDLSPTMQTPTHTPHPRNQTLPPDTVAAGIKYAGTAVGGQCAHLLRGDASRWAALGVENRGMGDGRRNHLPFSYEFLSNS